MLRERWKKNKRRLFIFLVLFSVCSFIGYAAYQIITITWIIVDQTPSIVLDDPADESVIDTNTSSFNWTTTDDGLLSDLDHVWYIDVVDTFTSPFLQAIGVDDNQTFTNIIPLDDGNWYWRVEVSDIGSNINVSETWNLTVQTNLSNSFPYLSSPSVSPSNGTNITLFYYNVTFFDSDNDTASYVNVSINSSYHFSLSEVDAGDTNTSNGKLFSYSTLMPVGSHNYSFSCSDGVAVNSTIVFDGPNVTGYSDFPPVQSDPSPANGSMYVEIPLSLFSINVSDQDGNPMSLYLYTNESGSWVLFNSTSGVYNGTYNFTNTGWADTINTWYWWRVDLSDGLYWSNATYCFKSEGLRVYNEYPSNDSNIINMQPTLVFDIVNPSGELMNYSIYIGNSSVNTTSLVDSASNITNGTYLYNNYYLANSLDTFFWRVTANDSIQSVNESFYFSVISGSAGGMVTAVGGVEAAALAVGMLGLIALVLFFSRRKKNDS